MITKRLFTHVINLMCQQYDFDKEFAGALQRLYKLPTTPVQYDNTPLYEGVMILILSHYPENLRKDIKAEIDVFMWEKDFGRNERADLHSASELYAHLNKYLEENQYPISKNLSEEVEEDDMEPTPSFSELVKNITKPKLNNHIGENID